MTTFCTIFRACSVLSITLRQTLRSSAVKRPKYSLNFYESVAFVNVRKMSQKSITSFFKITPKKSVEVKQESLEDDSEASNPNESPVKTEKRSSKRQRLDSSDEDITPTSPKIQTNSEKKKKAKRQRIDSSGSETELTEQRPEENLVTIRSNGTVKTYGSPRSKRAKESPIKESPKSEVKVKEEKATPETKKQKKSPVQKSPKTEKKSKKSTNPVQNGVSNDSEVITPPKVKEEKLSPKCEKDSEKDKGIKSEKDSKENKDSESDKDSKNESVEDKAKVVNAGKVEETEYNPAKPKYHPVDDACWSAGQPVPYLALARTLEAIEGTSARLRMIEILANYLRSVMVLTPEDLLPSVYMCLNQLAPAHLSVELGIAETYLMKAVGQATGRSLAQMKAATQRAGDLGAAAQHARAAQRMLHRAPPLTARRVFAQLKLIAGTTGPSSVNKKISIIQSLYVACRQSEAKYLIRSLEGKLRIGLAEQSVLQALALASTMTPPALNGEERILDASKGLTPEEFKSRVEENAILIKTTYCECPNLELVLPALASGGARALTSDRRCALAPGAPLRPMLALPARGVADVFHRFEGAEFTCEWKYDGERAQIHVPGDDKPDLDNARIFSRNQENNTSKYPDVLRRLPSLLKESVRSCVLDCEAVAYDVDKKQILPFQILSTRKRKDVKESEIKVRVCVFVFDLLYLNGAPLVRAPLRERRALLREHFNEVPGEWQFATSKDCSSVDEVQQFLEEAVKGSCEGLMIKMLTGDDARYDIARRSHNWLKLKKDYLEGVGDTIDAVVIGGYWGKGRRRGVWGGFLLACRDPASDQLQALCRLGCGFSDPLLLELSRKLQPHIIDGPRNYYRFDPSVSPDVWFAASRVWELRCADLSLSAAHRAAAGALAPDKGISLRFPRFVREREDKTPEEATTAQQIVDMYLSQDQVKNTAGNKLDYDDFY
ncbi:DNA ligase 1 isoform X2 [Plodia interpunctella]|uniref:DNA ligase 1 isoform X2 n=1 Tax=Plodia interpunctella TaxID=58824 RepID=UPI002368315A|nr:DNA ligase 1 isoform X2 [Plodia interpunctella]